MGKIGQFKVDLPLLSVFRRPDGVYLVTGFGVANTINRFGRDGRHKGVFGQSGHDAGGTGSPSRTAPVSAESLWVLDAGHRQVVLLDALGNPAQRVALDQMVPADLAVLDDGSAVVAARSLQPSTAAFPLHVIEPRSGIARPFGPPLSQVRPREEASLRRIISPARRGSELWAAHVNRYRLELLSRDGRILRVLNRTVDWFPAWVTNSLPVYESSKPIVYGLQVDELGRLWVFIAVTSPRFVPRARPETGGPQIELRGPPLTEVIANLDTVVEVIDPVEGVVLASSRIPGFLLAGRHHPYATKVVAHSSPEAYSLVVVDLRLQGLNPPSPR